MEVAPRSKLLTLLTLFTLFTLFILLPSLTLFSLFILFTLPIYCLNGLGAKCGMDGWVTRWLIPL